MIWQLLNKYGVPVGGPFVADTEFPSAALFRAVALGLPVEDGSKAERIREDEKQSATKHRI